VLLIRLPIGPRMVNLERSLVPEMSFEGTAASLQVPAVDYLRDPRAAALSTQDESHLAPDSARAFAKILADDLARRVGPE
jgi:hypothetical protein